MTLHHVSSFLNPTLICPNIRLQPLSVALPSMLTNWGGLSGEGGGGGQSLVAQAETPALH